MVEYELLTVQQGPQYVLERLLLVLGLTDQAHERLSLLLGRLARDAADIEVLDHLGDTLWRLGDAEGAVDAWRQAVEILQDAERRERLGQVYLFIQSRQWGLLVADPDEIHERQFGRLLEDAREKLRNAQEGGTPAVTATFEEVSEAEMSGDADDGRP